MAIPIIQTVGFAVMTLAAIIAAGLILFDKESFHYEYYNDTKMNEINPKNESEDGELMFSKNVLTLLQMGFDLNEIRAGLQKFDNDLNKTVEYLLEKASSKETSHEQESKIDNHDELNNFTKPLFDDKDNQSIFETESWIHKERRAIQQRLEYLEQLERSQEFSKPRDLVPNTVIFQCPESPVISEHLNLVQSSISANNRPASNMQYEYSSSAEMQSIGSPIVNSVKDGHSSNSIPETNSPSNISSVISNSMNAHSVNISINMLGAHELQPRGFSCFN